MSLKLNLLVLLLLALSHYAESSSVIKFLPGFEGPLPFELETGYIGIGEEEELQTFYYFIKSEKNPKEDPLLLWITGGPGCSSLTALFFRMIANIIFVNQPIEAGFSYKRTPNNDESSDTIEVVRLHEFLLKWLGDHPEFSSNPLYITGDSYSGKIVPAIVSKISKENYLCCKPPINLQGYVIGNPSTNDELQHNHRIIYAHRMALISEELFESLQRTCKGNYYNIDPSNTKCLKLVEKYHKCTDKINEYNIILPKCDDPLCWDYHLKLVNYWANDERVREAIQIRKGSIGQWHRCKDIDGYNMNIINSIPYYSSIKGYRSLIYSGDQDMVLTHTSTEAWIRSLNYSIIDHWRPWMINNQIAGYTRTYANNMTYATIKGCGHTVEYKPEEGFIMFQRWINGQNL